MSNEQEIWLKIKELLQGSTEEAMYKQLFEPINDIYKFQNGYIYLVVDSTLTKFRIEKYFLDKMNDLLSKFVTTKTQFKLVTNEDVEKEKARIDEISFTVPDKKEKMINVRALRKEYTFDNFVTGEANREAFTFAVHVAESPHVTINPFYIFGDVGLGKTHLMSAIGHYILDKDISINVVYTTAQQFVEDYFKSKNKNQKNTEYANDFDNYYRSADLLLVDDVQYLADRQGSQDEFFKLFEYLFENNKQIIITSDRPANELNIMARLKSRFSYGMQADIKKPNQQLREAIIKRKLKFLISDPSQIPDEVISYIASCFDQNVRELEGALRRYVSYCVAFNTEFTVENAQIALESIISKDKQTQFDSSNQFVEKLKEIIASYFNFPVKEISSQSRKQEYVYARSLTAYILKTKFNLSLNKIGQALGGRDHATVSHAIDKITNSINNDVNVKEDINNLITNIDKQYKN